MKYIYHLCLSGKRYYYYYFIIVIFIFLLPEETKYKLENECTNLELIISFISKDIIYFCKQTR